MLVKETDWTDLVESIRKVEKLIFDAALSGRRCTTKSMLPLTIERVDSPESVSPILLSIIH
jgi:hypothetical protein